MKFQILALVAMAAAIQVESKWGDTGIIDQVKSAPNAADCEKRLWISDDELRWQTDQFSRHFDVKNLDNALEIAGKLGRKVPKVHAWELNDKSFSFPRVRRYDTVVNNMDMLEHFQDNLNTNVSNKVNQENFIRTAKTVVANFNNKYHDGEYDDPANHDPRKEKTPY